MVVTDAYARACAVTGEHSLPALEAAHIKPFAAEGPHEINNGVLLRSDLHKLFDAGYVTVTSERRLEVSRRLRDDFQNGKSYYPLYGQVVSLPPLNRIIHGWNTFSGTTRRFTRADIASCLIDTNYNGESFFVRHAYFTGGDEPYEKLKRALRAEIDEGAWSTLYSTVSRPFAPPETGKIAVKVINHYGDEVLKVFTLAVQP